MKDVEDYTAEVTVYGSGWYDSGSLSGHPDSWYASEGEDEIEDIEVDNIYNERGKIVQIPMTFKELEDVQNQAWKECDDWSYDNN